MDIQLEIRLENELKELHSLFCEVLFISPNKIPTIPSLEFDYKMSRKAGIYYPSRKHIVLNLSYSSEGIESLIDTLAHELAHHFQFQLYPNAKQAHGREFRYILQMAGFNTSTYHTMSLSKAKETSESYKETLIEL